MKKNKKLRIILFNITLMATFCFFNTNAYAETMTPAEIQGPAYVIGSHVFTREVNETTGYEGRLTTNLIMLASQTIESNNLDNMIIYYKTATGMWINGLTGTPIEEPTSFEIDYTDLQLEEENNTVFAPKTPILDLQYSPISINEQTDMMSYQLYIYIDDIDDRLNKTDGVELTITDYDSYVTSKELEYGDDFSTTVNVLDTYEGDALVIGKKYHSDNIAFENPIDDFYNITAKAYVKDGNGKKTYSDPVYVAITPNTTLPSVEIVNNYSNPDYVTFDDTTYTYKLGIKKPDAWVFRNQPKKFAYIVYEKLESYSQQVGKFGINEEFTIGVAKDCVKTYYAQLGYYDVDGDFNQFVTSEQDKKYFTLDTRKTITTPVLELDQLDENYNHNRTYGDQVEVNSSTYRNAGEDTLDYSVNGMEIYQINYDGTTMSNFRYIAPLFGATNSFFVHVKPVNGMATYVGRAYATNLVGQKIYSEYSNIVTVIRTPEIEVSDIVNGKVNVSIKNVSEEYGTREHYDLKYKVFDSSGTELTELTFLDEDSSVDVDADTEYLYIRIYKTSDITENTYSAKSNKVNIVIE